MTDMGLMFKSLKLAWTPGPGYCPQARKIGVQFQTTISEKWEE